MCFAKHNGDILPLPVTSCGLVVRAPALRLEGRGFESPAESYHTIPQYYGGGLGMEEDIYKSFADVIVCPNLK